MLKTLITLTMSVLALMSLTGCDKGENQQAQYKDFDFRTFDRTIIADAPGCEIRSPQGELMNQIFKNAPPGKVTIQKGTTFSIDCFPIHDSEKSATVEQQSKKSESGKERNCATTGPNSPIVTGENSVVVVNGKTYAPGQSADCAPASTNISTDGAGSPIVTGAGSKVTISVEK